METLSQAITSTLSIPHSNNSSALVRSHGLSSLLLLRKPRSPANLSLISSRSSLTRASAVEHGSKSSASSIDLSDPDWKTKYEREFEERFSIPHITDVFPDAQAIRSTFCLKMRLALIGCFYRELVYRHVLKPIFRTLGDVSYIYLCALLIYL